jgi:hypothetical protein
VFVNVRRMIDGRMGGISKPIRKNLALVTTAFIGLCSGLRSGNGRLSLAAISRALPVEGDGKVREKRLMRLLANPRFMPETVIPSLVHLVVGAGGMALLPLIIDQTKIRNVPTILLGAIFRGRVLPVAFHCFRSETLATSASALEHALMQLVAVSCPGGTRPVFIGDRAYGRSRLLQVCAKLNLIHLVRVSSKVTVWLDGIPRCISKLKTRPGVPRRFANILYHSQVRLPVDLIVYHDPSFKETWYLVVPPGSESALPTDEVVRLYRERMQIEQGFRDWKTHLGVRGLALKVNADVRLTRLLLALSIAYIIAVLLGASPLAKRFRPRYEILRASPRHGTRSTLSVLSLGTLLLGISHLRRLACAYLARLLDKLARGASVLSLAPEPLQTNA